MKMRHSIVTFALAVSTVACNQQSGQDARDAEEPTAAEESATMDEPAANETKTLDMTAESFEIAPGLNARILRAGDGKTATAGDGVEVHYTGWLYDETASNNRGDKFDSSIDRGQRFQFPLGAGRVIQGWDRGVEGMAIGEVRELTIAPEMGYGDRGAGNAIPPGATLVFEVELFGAESLGPAPSQ